MFKTIGLLDNTTPIKLHHWNTLTRQCLANRLGTVITDDSASLLSALSELLPRSQIASLLDALNSLSIIPDNFSENLGGSAYSMPNDILPPVPAKPLPPIDLFATLLAHKLRYRPHERDLVVLSHEIITRPMSSLEPLNEPSGGEEVHVSSLVVSGTPEMSAMARCVGLPVAFAALGVLDGHFRVRGVQSPIHKEIYERVLTDLESVGLGMKENSRASKTGMTVEQSIGRP